MTKDALRPAATVIVLRDFPDTPRVLMGQRGANAAFMPNKFVFPGGAVDPSDADVPLANGLPAQCHARLAEMSDGTDATALAIAAIRELWEETGLILGRPAAWDAPSPDWTGFADRAMEPDASGMHYFFRAITPPGRPRRFDARFFLVDATALHGDLDDFSDASDELSHLQWVPLTQARALNLPFITSVVLAELAGLKTITAPTSVPFFENTEKGSKFYRLGQG